jgi:hypothetical protein
MTDEGKPTTSSSPVQAKSNREGGMNCARCGSAAVTERRNSTAQGYRRFCYGVYGKQFNERSAGALNRPQYPSDVIALVVVWRLRYRLALRASRSTVGR